MCSATKAKWPAFLIVRASPSEPSLVIAWGIKNPFRGQIDGARPIPMRKLGSVVQIREPVYEEIAADEIQQISLVFELLNEPVTTRQYPKL